MALVVAGCGGSSKPAHPRRIYTYGTTTISGKHRDGHDHGGKAAPPTPAEIVRAAKLTANEPGYRAAISAQISGARSSTATT